MSAPFLFSCTVFEQPGSAPEVFFRKEGEQAPFVANACIETPTPAACCRANQLVSTLTAAANLFNAQMDPTTRCIDALAGADLLKLGAGSDTAILGDGADQATLGAGNDVALGGLGNDHIQGGAGADAVLGGDGHDKLEGGDGNDLLDGGAGNDHLLGHVGDDRLFGGDGDDQLIGAQGNDTLIGGPGRDVLVGGPGNDLLIGGPDVDLLNGGPGDDTFEIRAACELAPGDLLNGGSGHDRLITPLTLAELTALGVQVVSIEELVIQAAGPGACVAGWNGELVCDCCTAADADPAAGCLGCIEGFHPDPDQQPVGGDFGDIGQPSPLNHALACVPDETCDGVECGHGTCQLDGGMATCKCEPGFIGAECDQCRPGFEPDADACAPSDACARDFCNGHGTCSLSPMGRLACSCDPGFPGSNCGLPDLQIGADPAAIEVDEHLAMVPSLANGASCAGGFTWSVTQGPGSVVQTPNGNSATYQPPGQLEPGELITAATVRVQCDSDPSMVQERAVCVLDDESLPVNGACKQELIPLDNAMLGFMKRAGHRGATLAITHAEDLVYWRAYGWRDSGSTLEMKTCTPMRVASITKAFTRAALDQLARDGVLAPDGTPFGPFTSLMDNYRDMLSISPGDPGPDCEPNCATPAFLVPASAYSGFGPIPCERPYLTGLPDPRLWNITMYNMYYHNSGFAGNDPTGVFPAGMWVNYLYPGYSDPAQNEIGIANALDLPGPIGAPSLEDLLRWMGGACLLDAPGAVPASLTGKQYSNIAYDFLGAIVARTSPNPADTFHEYLRDEVVPRVGDANSGWTPGDGMVVGDDLDLVRDLLFRARSLPPDTNVEEPEYLSDHPAANTVAGMAKNGGTWEPGSPQYPGAYAYLALENAPGASSLVLHAATMARFFLGFNVDGTRRRSGDPPITGLAIAGGYMPGTTAWHLAWRSRPIGYVIPWPGPGGTYGCAGKLEPGCLGVGGPLTPSPGLVTASVLFNKESPRADVTPNYDDGTMNMAFVIDALTAALDVPLDDPNNWPLPLTEAELQWGCYPYAPPPPPQSCGNGVIDDPDEACDGNDFGGKVCGDVGPYDGGTLSCSPTCKIDALDCLNPLCGNGVLDPDEQCDPGDGGPISTGNPNSEAFCSQNSCLWLPCGPEDAGREGCPCTGVGPDTEGDRCPGVNDPYGLDLICAYGPNHEAQLGLDPPDDGKRCMRCPYHDGAYGEGSGCPCGPGDACQPWSVTDQGPQVSACTRNEMVCRGAVGDLIRDRFDPLARCWDVLDADPFANPGATCDVLQCTQFDPNSTCLYADCESLLCLDQDGAPGICRAMGMICDPDPYGLGEPYCINLADGACDIPDSLNGTSDCGAEMTQSLNGGHGVEAQRMCPRPYRF